jgi:hypothetical protein
MFPHPSIAAALAEEHRRDLTARAEACRLARAARSSRPAPARDTAKPVDVIRQLITAARRTVMRLPLFEVPAEPFSQVPRARSWPGQQAPDLYSSAARPSRHYRRRHA